MKQLIMGILGGALAFTPLASTTANAASPQSALAGWLTQLSETGAWQTGVLGDIADDCKKDFSSADAAPSARLHRALATLLEVGETKAAQTFFKKFGYTIDYSNITNLPISFLLNTLPNLAKWPTANACLDDAYPTLKAALDSARDDLAGIPDDWTGTVRLSAADYPMFDEDVSVDVGDVQYMRSLLAAAEGALLYAKAQNLANNSAKIKNDLMSEKITVFSSAPTVSSTAWNNIAPVAFSHIQASFTNLVADVKVAICGNTLYVRLKKGRTLADARWSSIHMYAILSEGIYDAQNDLSFTAKWDSWPDNKPSGRLRYRLSGFAGHYEDDADVVVDKSDDAVLFKIDCSPFELASNKAFQRLTRLVVSVHASGSHWGKASLPYVSEECGWRIFNNQTKVLDSVRDASLLKTSKTLMEEALRLAKKADKSCLARRDNLLHFFEYDADDDGALRVMRENVDTAIASLSSAQKVDWTNLLSDEDVAELRKRDALENPLDVYLGALFSGKALRPFLPPSNSNDGYVPNFGKMKDPTIGGLFPKATVAKWKKFADATGIKHADGSDGGTDDDPDDDNPSAPEIDATYGPFVPGEKVELDLSALVGWTAKGLPSGLKFNKKTGAVTGAAKKPTAEDGQTVTFSKKGEATLTTQFVVGPIPTVSVELAGDVEKCSVAGAGKAYLAGKKVTLTAKAPKGTAFLGWMKEGVPWPDAESAKKAKLSFEMPAEDLDLVATFEKEKMSLACPTLKAGSFTVGVAGDAAKGLPLEITTQSGVKSVKASKLPSGMKLVKDKTTGDWSIVGTPTKAGTYNVVLTVTAVSGATETITIPVTVEPLPAWAVGTFAGVGSWDSSFADDDAYYNLYGTVSVGATGRLSGSLRLDTGDGQPLTAKLSAPALTGYDADSECYYYDTDLVLRSGRTVIDGGTHRLYIGQCETAYGDPPFIGRIVIEDDDAWLDLVQNVWKRKDYADKPVFAEKKITLTSDSRETDADDADMSLALTLVLNANGKVNATLLVEGNEGGRSFQGKFTAKSDLLVEFVDNGRYSASIPLPFKDVILNVQVEMVAGADGKIHANGCEITGLTSD